MKIGATVGEDDIRDRNLDTLKEPEADVYDEFGNLFEATRDEIEAIYGNPRLQPLDEIETEDWAAMGWLDYPHRKKEPVDLDSGD